MTRTASPRLRRASRVLAVCVALALSGCTSGTGPTPAGSTTAAASKPVRASTTATATGATGSPAPARPGGEFTINFAGDVHFADRVGTRLAANPLTVFGQAAKPLAAADLTMVNLETAITSGHGTRQDKAYAFQAPPSAFTALRAAGVDVATMANNHGADFGADGLRDTLRAIGQSRFPVVGIGRDENAAFAPYRTTIAGTKLAIFAADQVNDETTLRLFSARPGKAGVANAFDSRLVRDVRQAHDAGWTVVVYLHWGVEYRTCPSDLQRTLADRLARAGAAAVVGTHAHVLQGAGWRRDGSYVAYGLGNYLWWQSFGNEQDDNGILTLRVRAGKVVEARFAAAHLDSRGVPLPAAGALKRRIDAQWARDRSCAGLSARPPA